MAVQRDPLPKSRDSLDSGGRQFAVTALRFDFDPFLSSIEDSLHQ